MCVAQTRRARKRMIQPYQKGRKTVSVAESIARERRIAARQAAAAKKK